MTGRQTVYETENDALWDDSTFIVKVRYAISLAREKINIQNSMYGLYWTCITFSSS